ncbi:hypothetical protein AB0I60_27290 [Actinosynnema sp. NPDC050436]|uniref:hypothetical protein n=1 Tax=Actinosynnema sp. NPDC050436 TaxID=3155659 RepID=UPI0033E72351
MGSSGRWVAGIACLALLAPVVAGLFPTSVDGYRDAVVTAARDAASATSTAAALVASPTLPTYTDVVLADAREAVGTALAEVAELDVPDGTARGLRDEVLPLLTQAVAAVGDATAAAGGDDLATLRDQAPPLAQVGGRLRGFVEGHR